MIIASPLGISSNMLIKSAITRSFFLPNIGGSEHARAMKMVSIPRFSRSRNHNYETIPRELRWLHYKVFNMAAVACPLTCKMPYYGQCTLRRC